MAEAADIEQVKDLLPAEDDDLWADEKIGIYLDASNSVYKVAALFWESKAARLYAMIDVSESGSSRSLSKIYDNARSMAEYFNDRVAQEEVVEEKATNYTRIHKITRV